LDSGSRIQSSFPEYTVDGCWGRGCDFDGTPEGVQPVWPEEYPHIESENRSAELRLWIEAKELLWPAPELKVVAQTRGVCGLRLFVAFEKSSLMPDRSGAQDTVRCRYSMSMPSRSAGLSH